MRVRFNVSLPDALAERVEASRDSINLSALLADAVEKELDRMEALETTPKTRKARIAELKTQRREVGEADKEEGFKDGAVWANEEATYEDAEALYQAVHGSLSEPHYVPGVVNAMWDAVRHVLDEWFDDWDDEMKPANEEMYWEGVAEGAHEAWGVLREELA